MSKEILRRFERGGPAFAAIAFALVIGACADASGILGGNSADTIPPTVHLSPSTSTVDSVVAFSVDVKDNIGIKTIKVTVSGGLSFSYDTTFTSASTEAVIPFSIVVPRSIPVGTPVLVSAYALDGALNKSAMDSLRTTVGNVAPAEVSITSPAANTVAVVGKSVVLTMNARSALKIRAVGFRTTGSFVTADSSVYSTPLPDSVSRLDTLAIPATATTGPLTITPFVLDSLGQRTLGAPTVLSIQQLGSINSTPVVLFSHTPRVEVNDTLHADASDQTGITTLGYEIRRAVGGTVEVKDSVATNGNFSSQSRTFLMHLPYSTFPTTIYVQAFARNSNNVRAYAKLASGADRVDTVIVVSGATKALPNGGAIADALYHPRTDRLYLTNIQKNELEVFNLADSSFKTPINVGSRPWGIAPWPRDHNGTIGDTLLVANSGGTDISYVDLNSGSTGREVSRYALPNIIAYTIATTKSATGIFIQQRTKYDFSDRPQFLGATCGGGGFTCGDVILAYSTTPTGGQSEPFSRNNGTLRWENLMTHQSHFFFEQAEGQEADRSDTLEIVRYDANGVDVNTLVPYRQWAKSGTDSALVSTVVKISGLGFRDTTFVRNSGNFRRAAFGEGGPVQGTRAMTYDAARGLSNQVILENGRVATVPIATHDLGLSGAQDVSDFVANSFARVSGIAMNFDGSLTGVRADSTYMLNPALRLQGILPTAASNSGLDFHPANSGPNSFPLSSRLVFAASSDPTIDIYDSYCYRLVATVPIRDPIIGPIKAAIRPSTGQIVLVGATRGGVVIVTLPNTFTTSCQ
ncbi:MAG TPA: hypothetical protein VFC35_10095 [Gemmatimonadaceae bacterium]|nr:hypothetical protein [Gemmatimonadaceae bacterium]